jgi:hypothetical protein
MVVRALDATQALRCLSLYPHIPVATLARASGFVAVSAACVFGSADMASEEVWGMCVYVDMDVGVNMANGRELEADVLGWKRPERVDEASSSLQDMGRIRLPTKTIIFSRHFPASFPSVEPFHSTFRHSKLEQQGDDAATWTL